MGDDNEYEEENSIRAKINDFILEKVKAHIKLKNNSWRNGYVINMGSNFITFVDDKNGEEIIHMSDLIEFEVCRSKKESVGENA